EAMRAKGYNIGGEQSGHIILSDFSTTGDGLIAALQVLAALVEAEKPVSEVCHLFEPAPQLLENVRLKNGAAPLENEKVQETIRAAEKRLGAKGRIVVRKSGTEPLVRIMAEGDDEAMVQDVVGEIANAVRDAERAA
ncbi:MAG: phosphoglucosamine mutase, partial [Alphaproteobacteria bacterium]|nr:phosphoglucosamine mutase [Alphaproteobacteria bacterium]